MHKYGWLPSACALRGWIPQLIRTPPNYSIIQYYTVVIFEAMRSGAIPPPHGHTMVGALRLAQ